VGRKSVIGFPRESPDELESPIEQEPIKIPSMRNPAEEIEDDEIVERANNMTKTSQNEAQTI